MNKQMKPCAPAGNRRLWMKPGEASLRRQGKNRLHVVLHRYDKSHGLEKAQGITLLRWPLNQLTPSSHLTHSYHEEGGLNRFAIFLQYMLAQSYHSSTGGGGAEGTTEGFGAPEPCHRVLQGLTKGQNRDLLEEGVIFLPAKCWWPYLKRLQRSWKRCQIQPPAFAVIVLHNHSPIFFFPVSLFKRLITLNSRSKSTATNCIALENRLPHLFSHLCSAFPGSHDSESDIAVMCHSALYIL